MPQPFSRYKQLIDSFLAKFLRTKQEELSKVNAWGDDVLKRLKTFAVGGKTIRGGLVVLTTEAYGKNVTSDTLRLASAVELVHSGFLIHDDIMDQDRLRRGKPSVYAQYENMGKRLHVTKPLLFGQNMAISAADLSFFLAIGLVSDMKDKTVSREIFSAMSREYVPVGLAQMQDLTFGCTNKIPSKEEVISLYTYKTARYTFSLPFVLGALSAGTSQKEINILTKLGEQLGLIFQLTDDMLNLFGDPAATGKPSRSDLREGKKTLALVFLVTHAGNKDRQTIQAILKKTKRKEEDITALYQLFEKYQIKGYVQTVVNELGSNARRLIDSLSISSRYKGDILTLLEFLKERTT